ncbi:MAG TPA: TPM domain-containing protein [Gemmatimonadales bacterium]|nr:TPM domain-containing protein [Gemmatimonadales bacterium]
MKAAKLTGILIALQLAGSGLVTAQSQGISALFPAQPTGYLTDVAGVADPASAAAIDSIARRLRLTTGAELAVVTLPKIDPYTSSDVALAIGRAWGVGAKGEIGDQRRNAGVVLLLVPKSANQRGYVYLATGKGAEGIITDAIAGRIQDAMLDELRAGQYGPALVTGASQIASRMRIGLGVADSTDVVPDDNEGGGDELPAPVVLFIIFVVLIIIISRMSGGGRGGRRNTYWGGGSGWGGGFGGGFGGGGGFSGGGAGRSF